MKFDFKKITAVATSILMAGMTVGVAAAANYPAPFVVGGSADVAIVYGTGTGVSLLDAIQSGNIQTNLQSFMTKTTTVTAGTSSGGDSVKIEKSSTKLQVGKGTKDVISAAITDDSPSPGLPTLLADGVFIDNDNDEFDFTQKIDLSNLTLTMWEDSDYKEDEPTLGVKVANSNNVLNYTLTMTDQPLWSDLQYSDLTVLGKTYYILSTTNGTKLTLLDSANAATVNEGETTTVDVAGVSHEVGLDFVGSTQVRFNVDGTTTNLLAKGDTQKIGSVYVGVKEVLSQQYSGGLKAAEFALGTGKLELTSGSDAVLNDDTISGLGVILNYTGSSNDIKLTDIKLKWDAEDDLFVTEDQELDMPGFKAVKFTYKGLLKPEEEKITVKAGSTTYVEFVNFPLKDAVKTIPFIFGDSKNFTGIGKDATGQLRTTNDSSMTFDADSDDYFVASWSDGNDAESYYMKVSDFKEEGTGSSAKNKSTFYYAKDSAEGGWAEAKKDATRDDTLTIGNVELKIGVISKSGKTVEINASNSNVKFNTLYSQSGLKVYLPFNGTEGDGNAAHPGIMNSSSLNGRNSTFRLILTEEDKDGNKDRGKNLTVTLGWNSASTAEAEVTGVSGTGGTDTEIQDTDVFRNFIYSALGTEILWKKPSSAQKSLEVIYHGDESYGELYLSAPSTVITAGTGGTTGATQLGSVLVKDSEVSSVSTKNLVVVGGSCINSVAANLLGGAKCGSEFTDATGVGTGQFLIQSLTSPYASSKVALLVAGYEAADTVNAATYLTTQTVDTSSGKKLKGTSSTSAELVVE